MGKVTIGVQPDSPGTGNYSEKWAQFLEARGARVQFLDLLAGNALKQAAQCDGVMWRWRHTPQDKQVARRILYAIEHYLNLPVFPNTHTAWHYDDKVAQVYLLEALGAPTPRNYVFWDQDNALGWAERASYPVVFKLSAGAGSSNVVKVNHRSEAERLIHRAFNRGIFPKTMNEFAFRPHTLRRPRELWRLLKRVKHATRYVWLKEYPPLMGTWWKPEKGYVYFQEFLHGNAFDTRITVIGDRAFGFRRFNRPDDFRASGSGRIDHDALQIDPRCIEVAFDISERGKFQSMAYDFLYRDDTPLIGEISYTYLDTAVYACPGHWHRDLRWEQGNMWPEDAQVEVFLSQVLAQRKSQA